MKDELRSLKFMIDIHQQEIQKKIETTQKKFIGKFAPGILRKNMIREVYYQVMKLEFEEQVGLDLKLKIKEILIDLSNNLEN